MNCAKCDGPIDDPTGVEDELCTRCSEDFESTTALPDGRWFLWRGAVRYHPGEPGVLDPIWHCGVFCGTVRITVTGETEELAHARAKELLALLEAR